MNVPGGRDDGENEGANTVFANGDGCSLVLLMEDKRDRKDTQKKEYPAKKGYLTKNYPGKKEYTSKKAYTPIGEYTVENAYTACKANQGEADKNDANVVEGGKSKKNEERVITGMIKILEEMKESDDTSDAVDPGLNPGGHQQGTECATQVQNGDEVNRNTYPRRDDTKLHVGLDYSTFYLDTPYKIIKCMNKGSHFLFWGSDTLCGQSDQVTKEFKMNEMKKNNCEELRNSRFIFFDRQKKLLVLKYNIRSNSFNYVSESDPIYVYFYQLHEKNFLDDNIIKEKKNSILIYPYTYVKVWESLTCYINEEVINKIEPINKTFCSSFLEEEEKKKKKGGTGLLREEEMNLCNQPYMFYSVIPRYPASKTYPKEGRVSGGSRHKKEDNVGVNTTEGDGAGGISMEGDEAGGINMEGDIVGVNVEGEDVARSGVSVGDHEVGPNEPPNDHLNSANESYFERIDVDDRHKKYVPSDLTIIHLEKYWILKEIIQQEYTYVYYENEKKEGFHKFENKLFYILGEFQFAYILFHLGFNYQSFVQWRKLFELLSNSQHLVTNFADFFEEALRVISIHLSYLSDDFFDNTDNSFILFGVYNIYEIVSGVGDVQEGITNVMNSIDSIIYAKLGLHLPDLSFVYEEFQPTYVDDD
ncbi:hypothetical protein PCYB_141490 [Plasmodium cynomolgi strain B]|uniref:AAR2 protein n=1 Tax=Plasmodium cynomolgi (strain B) TaxID=1120755 RepID=K6UEP7_PLACD|nr:hypothetical protein PCYB_141490 [Plasmodium cynomolgi strain B]GAB68721.1 hypothetical protein PCYB_141490 [Plasmodium cynomolgi strain B]